MDILLDTHSLIWFSEGNTELTEKTITYIKSLNNNIYVSIASLWEIAIKLNIGKLFLTKPFDKFIQELELYNFEILPIKTNHLIKYSKLQIIHRDPFDRIIISQALFEDLPIISKDKIFDSYGVARIW